MFLVSRALVPVVVVPTVIFVGAVWGRVKASRELKLPETWAPESREAFLRLMKQAQPNDTEAKEVIKTLRKGGQKGAANQLEKRMKLSSLPREVQERRHQAVKKALKSKDKDKVIQLANILEDEGAFSTAQMLRQYAEGLT